MDITIIIVAVFTVLQGVVSFPLEGNGIKAKSNLSAADIELRPRSMLTNPERQWTRTRDALGKPMVIVPYRIGNFQPQLLPYLHRYINEFADKSCIRWMDVGSSNHMHVMFTSAINVNSGSLDSCNSQVGKLSQSYEIHINTDCAGITHNYGMKSNIPHEMLHALGFIHEHQRADRDCYVAIRDDLKRNHNYEIFTYEHTDLTFPYNPKSVMQYPSNGRVTSKLGDILGPETDSLHWLDWMQVNNIYCGGPHICQTDPGLCEHHKNLKLRGGCPLQ